jgi:hypothetical protein
MFETDTKINLENELAGISKSKNKIGIALIKKQNRGIITNSTRFK